MSYQIETINKEISYKELSWNFEIEKYTNWNKKESLGGSKADLSWQKKEPAKQKQAQSRLFSLRDRKKKNEKKNVLETCGHNEAYQYMHNRSPRGEVWEKRERERNKKNIEELLAPPKKKFDKKHQSKHRRSSTNSKKATIRSPHLETL